MEQSHLVAAGLNFRKRSELLVFHAAVGAF
jgi:hypothetical protein